MVNHGMEEIRKDWMQNSQSDCMNWSMNWSTNVDDGGRFATIVKDGTN